MPSIVLCGVPSLYCTGGRISVNAFLRSHITKGHGSASEAFKCYANYLKNEKGYVQVGPREFQLDEESPVLVLTKKTRFGERLRWGKNQDRWMPKMPGCGAVIKT